MKTKLIIFDMDGVLVDSEKIYKIIIKKARLDLGVVFPPEEEQKTMGATREANKRQCKRLFGEDFDYDGYRQHIDDVINDWFDHNTLEVKKGIFELLDYCDSHGIKKAVGTSSSGFQIDRSLKPTKLYDRFDLITTGADVKNSKPDPEIYNITMEKMGFKPEETLIIEDSNFGVLAGAASKARCIYIPDVAPVFEETKKQAYMILEDAGKIIELLEKGTL